MKSFINIVVHVPVDEPENEGDGARISIDAAGIVVLSLIRGDRSTDGTFEGRGLVKAIENALDAFNDAERNLDPPTEE